ncbi:AimR family lysis-lysogeny pheromone receptor [Bacillus toyonensis]|uniref:AimR family lysis-lysogeny pheromone receptor n=1 Tax=Bacillus toyonensis TaxID=155322 RepID=UPI002E1D4DDA|nr:AimR family lysis-lysogeny pheromone receptor [Bacillus toyonensis]
MDNELQKIMTDMHDLIFKKMSMRKFAKMLEMDRKKIIKGLTGQSKTEMKLDVFLKIVYALYEDEASRRKRMNLFILEAKTPLNIRKGVCFAHVCGEYSVIKELVGKHAENVHVAKYLKVYDIYNQRSENKLKGQELIDKIEGSATCSDPECQTLMNLIYMVAMYDQDNAKATAPYAKLAYKNLQEIEQKFIQDCLTIQYNERIAYQYLLNNDIKEAREKCYEIINCELQVPILKATAKGCLGESYIYECPLTAEKHITEALSWLEEIKVPKQSQKFFAFKTTLAHLYLEYNFNIDKIDFNYIHVNEEALYECLHGDREKGLSMFKSLKEKGFTAHQLFTYSKVTNDLEGLRAALISFQKNGNIFYSEGVKRILMKEEVTI